MTHKIDHIDKWKLAYVAGILDGEGWIGISKRSKTMTLTPAVEVSMSDIKCISLLHNVTGLGTISIKTNRGWSSNTMYYWCIRGRLEIYWLLKAVHPFLVTKREQADIMIEFLERRLQDVAIDSRDFQLREKIHNLNEGGTYIK